MKNRNHQDLLIKKYEEFEIEWHQEKKILLRFEILNILHITSDLNSDDFHSWGLTYYMSDDDKEYHKRLAPEKFLQAYELDPGNFLACLYICDYNERDNRF